MNRQFILCVTLLQYYFTFQYGIKKKKEETDDDCEGRIGAVKRKTPEELAKEGEIDDSTIEYCIFKFVYIWKLFICLNVILESEIDTI